jgi:hypothetical protein
MGQAARISTVGTERRAKLGLLPKMATVATAFITAVSAAGCGASEPKPQSTVEIEEIHLDAIREAVPDVKEYTQVTVTGEVKRIISPSSFSIINPEEPSVKELLIVHEKALDGLSPEQHIKVTGVVYRGFDVAEVKKETGINLGQALHDQWHGDSYIVASRVAPSAGSR